MNKTKRISAVLSVATALLLKTGCSDEGGEGDSGQLTEPNTTAPQLLGEWRGICKNTPTSTITSTAVTVTAASGGGGGGGGGGANGESERTTITFNQNGTASGVTDYFSASDCNSSFNIGLYRFDITYTVGADLIAVDGSNAKALDLIDGDTVTYTIFQVVNTFDLYLGDAARSTPGNDGVTSATRFNGLGERFIKQ